MALQQLMKCFFLVSVFYPSLCGLDIVMAMKVDLSAGACRDLPNACNGISSQLPLKHIVVLQLTCAYTMHLKQLTYFFPFIVCIS